MIDPHEDEETFYCNEFNGGCGSFVPQSAMSKNGAICRQCGKKKGGADE